MTVTRPFTRSAFLVAALILAYSSPSRAISLQKNVLIGNVMCDLVTWTDRGGKSRKAYLVNDSLKMGDPMGGIIYRFQYDNGSVTKTCDAVGDGAGGFGNTVNHGNFPGSSGGAWLNGRMDSYDPMVTTLFSGDHHLIWQSHNRLSIKGQGTEPSIWLTRDYVFKDGEDQWQYCLTFDTRHLALSDVPEADSRSPYNNFIWWGDATWPATNFGYGTTYRCDGDAAAMTYSATVPYNLCPYVYSYLTANGHDDEIGMVQTRLISKHKAGRNASTNGKSGPFTGTDLFDFQFADFQNWLGGRTCWQAYGPNGDRQMGTTAKTENYSITCEVGPHSSGTCTRLTNENNAAQASGTALTASVGTVDAAGPEGAGLALLQVWDKKGYDQLYRNWSVTGMNNHITATLTIAAGATISRPTFVMRGYTASAKPISVSKAGVALAEGTGYYASVDTVHDQCWVTFLSDFSGATTVDVVGPSDQSGITISSFTSSPASTMQGLTTAISFSAMIPGASSATLDLREFGGTSAVPMTKSGTNFSLTMPNASVALEGHKMVTLRATGATGGSQSAATVVDVKRPDLVVYADAITGTSADYVGGGGGPLAEVASGAFEGAKCMRFQYTGSGNGGGILLGRNVDARAYRYAVVTYKGPSGGQNVVFNYIGSDTWWGTGISLPASPNAYTSVAIPMFSMVDTSYLNEALIFDIRFSIQGSGPAGDLYVDNLYFTNWPSVNGMPTTVGSSLVRASVFTGCLARAMPNLSALELAIPENVGAVVTNLKGAMLKQVTVSKRAQHVVWSAPAAGAYLVRFAGLGHEDVRKVVIR